MSGIHRLYKANKYKFVLVSFLIILGVILFKELRIYMSSFLSAATLYVLLKSQMSFLVEKWKFRKGLAAILLTLEGLLFFLIPLTGVAFLVIDTVTGITIDPRELIESVNNFVDSLESKLDFKIFTPENLSSLPKIGGNILQSLGAGIYSLIINSVFSMFILFYMLLNYDEFDKMVREILPMREENKQILAEETKLIIQANATSTCYNSRSFRLFGIHVFWNRQRIAICHTNWICNNNPCFGNCISVGTTLAGCYPWRRPCLWNWIGLVWIIYYRRC